MTSVRFALAAMLAALTLFLIAAADVAGAEGKEIRKDITVEVLDQSHRAAPYPGELTSGNRLRLPQRVAAPAPKARDFLIQQGVPAN